MIDLTPLDVRKKAGDFRRLMRGYDPQEVDVFLELVAERLEALVRENLQLKERVSSLGDQVSSQQGREQAVQDALVTAQELRADIQSQAQRESELMLREADTEARRIIAEAEARVLGKLRSVERQIDEAKTALQELERRRHRFIKDFRALLERELDAVGVEEARTPLEDRPIDLELGGTSRRNPGRSVRSEDTREAEGPAVQPGEPAEPAGSGDGSSSSTVEAPDPAGHEPAGSSAGSSPEADSDAHRPAPLAPRSGATESGRETRGDASAGPQPDAVGRSDGGPVALAARDRAADPADAPPVVAREPGDPRETEADDAEPSLPTELELPTFAVLDTRERGEVVDHPYGDLSASMEAEARAEAQSQVVEVTGSDADTVPEVPRLEEVLAEAGAEMVDAAQEPVAQAPTGSEKIDPPRISRSRPDQTLLLYPDKDAPDR